MEKKVSAQTQTNGGPDAKGKQLLEEGDKALNTTWFWSWFSTTSRFEQAAELYMKAANQFKITKNWDLAGQAFVKAAEAHLQIPNAKHEAAQAYINAANAYKKTDSKLALKYSQKGVDLYTDEGQFSIAAKQLKDIAESYEQEMDFENAMNNYQQAADYYLGENSVSASNTCLLKVAHLAADLERYNVAIETFEKVASQSIDKNLLKWNVKDYYFKALLCHLCSADVTATKRAYDKYCSIDATFATQREAKFFEQLLSSCENYDMEAFLKATAEYDTITPLNNWETTMLCRIKEILKGEALT